MTNTKTMHEALSVTEVPRLLGFESFKPDHLFTPPGNRGVFGGQVIEQALMAAIKTVEGKDLHSQHCYFLLPCNSQIPLTYAVERLRDGKSYATRLVHAVQDTQTIFIMVASFTLPPITLSDEVKSKAVDKPSRDSFDDVPVPFSTRYQANVPDDIASFASIDTDAHRWAERVTSAGDFGMVIKDTPEAKKKYLENQGKQMPVNVVRARPQSGKYSAQRALWLHPRLTGGRLNQNEVKAMIGYMTDSQTVAAAGRTVGLSATSDPEMGMLATIDHTIHFYPFPPEYDGTQPVLHVLDAQVVDIAAGRGFVTGRLYTQEGVLIAATSQEGVVRIKAKGVQPRSEAKL